MIDDKSVLAIVPARGGSKELPGKNSQLFHNRPLFSWTVDIAKQSSYIDRVVVSSDDNAILKIAKQHGNEVPLKRPAELSRDETPGVDPVLHALEVLPGYDYVVLLQPTSPLRNVDDIDKAILLCHSENAPACASITTVNENPYWMYTVEENKQLTSLIPAQSCSRRQDMPEVFRLNGAIYIADTHWLKMRKTFVTRDTIAYPMPKSRSIDIDTANDFRLAEMAFASSSLELS